jgi:hypothetical protein
MWWSCPGYSPIFVLFPVLVWVCTHPHSGCSPVPRSPRPGVGPSCHCCPLHPIPCVVVLSRSLHARVVPSPCPCWPFTSLLSLLSPSLCGGPVPVLTLSLSPVLVLSQLSCARAVPSLHPRILVSVPCTVVVVSAPVPVWWSWSWSCVLALSQSLSLSLFLSLVLVLVPIPVPVPVLAPQPLMPLLLLSPHMAHVVCSLIPVSLCPCAAPCIVVVVPAPIPVWWVCPGPRVVPVPVLVWLVWLTSCLVVASHIVLSGGGLLHRPVQREGTWWWQNKKQHIT